MTDRVHMLTVALDRDYRDDDPSLEVLVTAIRALRRVVDVKEHVVDGDLYVAEMRVKTELTKKLYEVLRTDK